MGFALYFYPRSPCGERRSGFCCFLLLSNFYPRSPCGERPGADSVIDTLLEISIHALLAESDPQPGLYRATHGYFYPRSPCGERPSALITGRLGTHFYPRSPCGERHYRSIDRNNVGKISIHALLAESDVLQS